MSSCRGIIIASSVGAAGLIITLMMWKMKKKKARVFNWERVGAVSQLNIYPVKSAKGITVNEAFTSQVGLTTDVLQDRSFIVVNEDNSMVTARTVGKLVTIDVSIVNSQLTLMDLSGDSISVDVNEVLKAKSLKDVNIRGVILPGYDCGDGAAHWLSKMLYDDKKNIRLLFKGDLTWNRDIPDNGFPFPGVKKEDNIAYQDRSAFLVMTEASLFDLNTRLDSPASMRQFRPSIVIDNSTGAYDEDDWVYVKIGTSVILRRLQPCSRCLMIDVDPATGERNYDLLETLNSYRTNENLPKKLAEAWRGKPVFGSHFTPDDKGNVRVGDEVFVSRLVDNPEFKLPH